MAAIKYHMIHHTPNYVTSPKQVFQSQNDHFRVFFNGFSQVSLSTTNDIQGTILENFDISLSAFERMPSIFFTISEAKFW